MIENDWQFLISPVGQKLLSRYSQAEELVLDNLIRQQKTDRPGIVAIVEQIRLRRQAGAKFSRSGEMFFTRLSLEQATGEKVARLIAQRFKSDWTVADLTCGLGGNAIFLADRVKKVLAVDLDEEKIRCARANAQVYGVSTKIDFQIGDAYDFIKPGIEAFFLDPARDREGQTKTRSFLNSTPDLLSLLPALLAITKNIAVKISPAFDYDELKLLPENPEVEIISEDNNCKVAMLWFGDLKKYERSASCLCKNEIWTVVTDKNLKSVPVEAIKKYLYEPNKAVSKARLVDELAAAYKLSKINPYLSLLSGDSLIATDKPGLFRVFEILHHDNFSLKKLQAYLKQEKIERAEIIAKRFYLKPEELRSRLKLKEGGNLVIILLLIDRKNPIYLIGWKIKPDYSGYSK
jgi:SAM-dependent methyltransferase